MRVSLRDLAKLHRNGTPRGITSVCSAHPIVLRAALRHGRDNGSAVLIEATCNQVNHLGGYTGMRPAEFVAMVMELAGTEGCPVDQIILGGDHLGPNPWRETHDAGAALLEAEKMVKSYVEAGFRKIHLDASMGCKGEPVALDDETTARRAVRLAAVAEETAIKAGGDKPLYIIGTEVPPPGGADHFIERIQPTSPEAARRTIDVHRDIFQKAGQLDAFQRVIGLVVQPGVEFGNKNITLYDREEASALSALLNDEQQIVFEAHSTDYQGRTPLTELVGDGFAILKVGPELTFVLREALYALDLIASDLLADYGDRPLMRAMDDVMQSDPGSWKRHYGSDPAMAHMLMHYSLSDRIRYFWPQPEAREAVEKLLKALKGVSVPLPLLWQHLPGAEQFANNPLDPEEVLIWRITKSLDVYHAACMQTDAPD